MKFGHVAGKAAVLVLALATVGGSAPSFAASTPKSGEFNQVSTVITPTLTMKSTDHVTFKGVRYKLESTDIDNNYTPYQDVDDGQSYFRYFPAAKVALRVPLTSKPQSPLDTLREQTQQKLVGATKTGETTVNGFNCDVYTHVLGQGAKVELYVSKDPRFPYVVKTMLTVPSEGVTQTSGIEDVKLDIPVSDDAFLLPKGTKIVAQPARPSGSSSPDSAPPATGQDSSQSDTRGK